MNWKSLLGKRVLIQGRFRSVMGEVVVEKISPSGEEVKFQWRPGVSEWENCDSYKLLEVLDNQRKKENKMTKEKFDEFFEEEVKRCKEIMDSKNADYAAENDKLANFKQAGSLAGITPIEALWWMDLKHRTSITEAIMNDTARYNRGLHWWQEKVRDHINYCFLLLALVQERCEERV